MTNDYIIVWTDWTGSGVRRYLGRWVSPFLQATKALREMHSSTLFLDLGTRRG
jgi:hypothetical protein